MSDTQLYLAIGVPVVMNAIMIGLCFGFLLSHINVRFEAQDKLFTERLRRVEEVLDARLRLIEDKLGIR